MPTAAKSQAKGQAKAPPKGPAASAGKRKREAEAQLAEAVAVAQPQSAPASSSVQEEEEDVTRYAQQKMLNTMRYQAKVGNRGPLDHYMGLTSRQEKAEFVRRYISDKKFGWLRLREERSHGTSSETSSTEGWLSKYQIAAAEKVPVESPLLEALLASLPARAHRHVAWAEQGEKEYYYEGVQKHTSVDTEAKRIQITREGTVKGNQAEQMEDPWLQLNVEGPPPKSLEDGVVKGDPGDMEVEELRNEARKLQKEIKKISHHMTQWQATGLACVEKMKELTKEREYLKPLAESVEKALATFTPQRETVVRVSQTCSDAATKENVTFLNKVLQEGKAHLDGFKGSAVKDAVPLVKGPK